MSRTFFARIRRSMGNWANSKARPRLAVACRRLGCEPLESRCLLSLGTYALAEGPAAGTDLVIGSGGGTAAANASWLHLASYVAGNAPAKFNFDANPGATRAERSPSPERP